MNQKNSLRYCCVLLLALSVAACGGDNGDDGGDDPDAATGGPDAATGGPDAANPTPDAAPMNPDANPNLPMLRDCGEPNAPAFCITDGLVQVGETQVTLEVHYTEPNGCAGPLNQGGGSIDHDETHFTLANEIPGSQQWVECVRRELYMGEVDYWIHDEDGAQTMCDPHGPGKIDELIFDVAPGTPPGQYPVPSVLWWGNFNAGCEGMDEMRTPIIHVL